MTGEQAALGIYLVGALIALVRTDAARGTRVLLAALWPVGPLAFVVTVGMLVAVATVAFPMFGVVVIAAAGAAWYLL